MRPAFQHYGSDVWVAGNAFIENKFLALRTLGPDCPNLVLVVGEHSPEQDNRATASGAEQVLRAKIRVPDPAPPRQLSLRYHFRWWLRTRLLKAPEPTVPHPLAEVLLGHDIDGFFTAALIKAVVTAVSGVL
jgi:hypothetical protein